MSVQVHADGSWSASPHDYEIDQVLGHAIAKLMVKRGLLEAYDLGCGAGGYVKILRQHGIWCRGFDLNPRTAEFCEGCEVRDVAMGMTGVSPVDAVLSLEVGEHVPPAKEAGYFYNLMNLARSLVVLSWFPYPGEGIGHINEHPNEYVIERMAKGGFAHDGQWTANLRGLASLWWFKKSLMVFNRA